MTDSAFEIVTCYQVLECVVDTLLSGTITTSRLRGMKLSIVVVTWQSAEALEQLVT